MGFRALGLGILGTASVFAASASSALDTGEFPIGGARAEGAEVAAAADRFLVVWTDRTGLTGDVRGMILRASDGQPEGRSFPIAASALEEREPTVASDGYGFLVGWVQGSPPEMRVARVSKDGDVIDPGGILTLGAWSGCGDDASSYEPTRVRSPRLASNGTEWAATWTRDHYSEPYTGSARISNEGVVLGPLVNSCGTSGNPHITAAGRNFYVTCFAYDPDTASGRIITPDGNSQWGSLGYGLRVDAVGSNGTDFLVTYFDDQVTSSVEVDGSTAELRETTRQEVSGVLEDGPHRQHSSIAFAGRWLVIREERGTIEPDVFLDGARVMAGAWSPKIAVAGGTALVVATRGLGIVGRAFSVDSPLVSIPAVPTTPPEPTASPTPAAEFGEEVSLGPIAFPFDSIAIAGGDETNLAVWTKRTGTLHEVYGFLVRNGEAIGPGFLVATDARFPAVFFDGTTFTVLWTRLSSPSAGERRSTRISSDGVILDPADTSFGPSSPYDVRAVWGGTSVALAWQERFYGVRASRAAIDGSRIETAPIVVGGYGENPEIFSNGSSSLIVYRWSAAIWASVLHDDGTLVPPTRVGYSSGPSSGNRIPSVASNGRDFLLTYECAFRCRVTDPPSAVYRHRTWAVDLSGETGAPWESTRRPISGVLSTQYGEDARASVAFAGRWVFAREEPGPEIFVDQTKVFANAVNPRLMISGASGVVVARRGSTLVARTIRFPEAAMPEATPTPSSSPTPTPAPVLYSSPELVTCATPTPVPSATPSATPDATPTQTPVASPTQTPAPPADSVERHDQAACSVATGNRSAVTMGILALVALASWTGMRARKRAT